jgi:Uncharacterized conserved protein
MPSPTYAIPALPPAGVDLERVEVLRALAPAHRYLAELKGSARSIPNQGILVDTLTLQEAKASAEVESYVTTQDELFQAELFPAESLSPAAKEVSRYREALKRGFERMQDQQDLLTSGTLIDLFQYMKNSSESFRHAPGTVLKNDRTGRTVFVPPQDRAEITRHMDALEQFINAPNEQGLALDPLVRMAIIHHQFESIHPFSDGNGRIGRILCVLYLVKEELLELPVLYLSRYINRNKPEYYRLLQAVRDEGAWSPWIVFMLQGVAVTAESTIRLVHGMRDLMASTKQRMRDELPGVYSQDLLNNLFRHPYTRIEAVVNDIGVSRQTASKYLKQLQEIGILTAQTRGKNTYFINEPLVQLISEGE